MDPQYPRHDIETPLLRALANLQRREPRAEEQACAILLNAPTQSLAPLVPLLRSILSLDNKDLLLITAKRLAELGQRAEGAIEDLKALALRKTFPASCAAVEALGSIAGERVLEVFIEIGESWARDKEMREPIANVLVPAFLNNPSDLAPYIQRLDVTLSPCFDDETIETADQTRHIQQEEPHLAEIAVLSPDLSAISFPNVPNLNRNAILESADLESIPTQLGGVLRQEMGGVLDGHLLPITVEIHSPASSSGNVQYIAILELRGPTPAGWTFDETLATVTSLVREKFNLPPHETIWVEHTSGDSGAAIAPFEKTFRVDMIYFDMLERYGLPRYTGVPSVQAVLDEIAGRTTS